MKTLDQYWVAFKNYVDRKGWKGDQSNVFSYMVNDRLLFTSLSMRGGWLVQKV